MPLLFSKPISSRLLVGRQAELAGLQPLIDQARIGHGQFVLLSGEAGIGKSRLAAEVETRAHQRGFLALRAACYPADRSSPFAPLLDLFGRTPAVDLAPIAHELSLLHPGIVPAVGAEARGADGQLVEGMTPPEQEPEQARRRLFISLTQFFASLAAVQPLLLTVEDIHWADDASLELLHWLGRRCAAYPLVLLVTYRDDEIQPELRDWLAQTSREQLAHQIFLAPLSSDDVGEMLRSILDLPGPPNPETGKAIYELTEGNPFFVEEIVKSLVTARGMNVATEICAGLPSAELPIPASLHAAVQQRIEPLTEAAREALVLAAVAGRRFDFDLLQELMARDEEELLLLMKELIAAHLVVEESAALFSFRHALTREAIYAQLLLRERKALHRRLGETMERVIGPTPEAHFAELAGHFEAAGVWEKALEYAHRAGKRAQALYAPRVAIDQFTRALKAAHHVKEGPVALLYHLRGQAHEVVGEFDQARSDYERALDAAVAAQDGKMQWQAAMDLGFLWTGRNYQRSGRYFRQAVMLGQTLADPRLRGHSLNRLGNWLLNTGQVAEARQAHEEALAVFERQQDRAGVAETLDLLGLALAWSGDAVAAARQHRRAIELMRALDDKRGLVSILPLAGLMACPALNESTGLSGRPPDECERDAIEAAQLARQIGWPAGEAFAVLCRGLLIGSLGQFGKGLALIQSGFERAQEIGHEQWMVAAHCDFAQIYLLMLQSAPALEHLEAALPVAEALGSAYFIGNIKGLQALAYLQQGACRLAERTLRTVMFDAQKPRTTVERRLVWVSGELALAQGDAATALDVARRLSASAPGAAPTRPIPWLCRLEGEALAALDRPTEAADSFEAARRGAAERQEAPVLWQIDRSLGRVYRALKREQHARDRLAAAHAGIESLATTIDDAILRERFYAAAINTLPKQRSLSARRATAEKYGGLTERERSVAALIAGGSSNRDIAQQLVVSDRTVESHVANILFKLGFDSRAQVAAWAVKVGLVEL